MTWRLSEDHMDQLEAWIDSGPKTFNLLYSITRDGCGPGAFHSKCDNEGPTVTVLYNPKGSVYGGYTSLDWKSPRDVEWKRDDQAFLFQLVHSYQKLCRKFPSKMTGKSIYHDTKCGPCFGDDEFSLFNKKIDPVHGVFSLDDADGDMEPYENYECDEVTPAEINNDTMDVVEVEIYSVAGTYLS